MNATNAGPPDVPQAAIDLAGVRWRPLGRRDPVLDGLDLRIGPGERVLLVGATGSGKTTVLRAIAGLLGEPVPGELSGRIDVSGRLGMLLQNPAAALVAECVGREVAFGPENLGLPRDEIWRRVGARLVEVGLAAELGGGPDDPAVLDRPTGALSGGQTQRLALAGLLAMDPTILLLDEPTAMLDPAAARVAREAILASADRRGATVVIVEHLLADWLPHVDRVVMLDRGRIVRDGSAGLLDTIDPADAPELWLPGLPAPQPLAVPTDLVAPAEPPRPLRADGLVVDLVTPALGGRLVYRALDGVDAELPAGRLTAITGPSGGGKSTLLAALGGLLPPTSGRVNGPAGPSRRLRSRALARLVGWVPQNPEHGLLARTVAEEVTLTARRLGRRLDPEPILAACSLTALAGREPHLLSGGEQRRLALAGALAHRPAHVLLDEPTVGQDRLTWRSVAGWAVTAAQTGATVGVATHDPELAGLGDTTIRLARGRRADVPEPT